MEVYAYAIIQVSRAEYLWQVWELKSGQTGKLMRELNSGTSMVTPCYQIRDIHY